MSLILPNGSQTTGLPANTPAIPTGPGFTPFPAGGTYQPRRGQSMTPRPMMTPAQIEAGGFARMSGGFNNAPAAGFANPAQAAGPMAPISARVDITEAAKDPSGGYLQQFIANRRLARGLPPLAPQPVAGQPVVPGQVIPGQQPPAPGQAAPPLGVGDFYNPHPMGDVQNFPTSNIGTNFLGGYASRRRE